MITQSKLDAIQNALLVGMTQADAFVYAGLTAAEVEEAQHDEALQLSFSKINKELEYSLLKRMDEIAERQIRMGKEGATAWMLEHLYPRYSGKPQAELPEIHIHMDDKDPAEEDTVTIVN